MGHNASRCPNCGRALTDEEIYCYFCETGLPKITKGRKGSGKKQQGNKHS